MKKQKETDRKEIERATATLSSFVEKAYSKSELLVVWADIRSLFEENQWDNLPEVEKNTKPYLASAICQAREVIKRNNPSWADETRASITESIAARDEAASQSVDEKLGECSGTLFFRLAMSYELKDAYSTKYGLSIALENESHEQLSQGSNQSTESLGASNLDFL